MSGGRFDYNNHQLAYVMVGRWCDEELNELFFDMFGGGYNGYRAPFSRKERECEFEPRGGGLAESLDFYLSGDTDEEDYRADVAKFKAKWLARRTPKNRVEFYRDKFTEYATDVMERFREELGEV